MNSEERKQWLAALKPGDEVDCERSVQRVARVTPTQIVVRLGNLEIRFDRDDGWQRGASRWHRASLRPLTQETRDSYEHRDLAQWLKYMQHEKLTLTQLRAIRAVVEPVEVKP